MSRPRMRILAAERVAVTAAIGLVLQALGCQRDPLVPDANLPPTVVITEGAPDGGPQSYRVSLGWEGADPDGVVDHYLYAIHAIDTEPEPRVRPVSSHVDVLEWTRIDETNGTFWMQAANPVPGQSELARNWNAFFLLAVDDDGARSEIEVVFVDAETTAPTISRNPAIIDSPALACGEPRVSWTGEDLDAPEGVDGPIGYQFKLIETTQIEFEDLVVTHVDLVAGENRRANRLIPDSLIVEGEPSDSTYRATDWYPKRARPHPDPFFDVPVLKPAYQLLAIRAVDAAGAVTPAEAFDHEYIARISSAGAVEEDPITIRVDGGSIWGTFFLRHREGSAIDLFSEQPLRLTLTPQSPIDCLSYESAWGLDLPDPFSEEGTATDGVGGWTDWQAGAREVHLLFEDVRSPEVHTLWMKVRDTNQRFETRAFITLNTFPPMFSRRALFIDDFVVAGFDDCRHDSILIPIIEHAVAPHLPPGDSLDVFDVHGDVGACSEMREPDPVPFGVMVTYETIFWTVSGQGAGSGIGGVTGNPTVASKRDDLLQLYVEMGGNLVVWGRNTIGHMLGDYFPLGSAYIAGKNFGPGSFVWDILRLETRLDFVNRGTDAALRHSCSGLVGLEATPAAVAAGFPAGVPDPTGYDPSRTALWWNQWMGAENPFGSDASCVTGPPALHVQGLDTLYTYISNSWSYASSGPEAIRDACGSSFLSPFEGDPVAVRYAHPSGRRGRVAWLGAPIYVFGDDHLDDLKAMMRAFADWVFE